MPPSMQITPPVGDPAQGQPQGQPQGQAQGQDGVVAEFYRGANVFMTGATGFMGKVLLEKLLRSCPDLGTVYVLIRPKKNQMPEQRMEAVFDCPLFQRLREERPKFRHQVVAVAGDCSQPDLGLSKEDRATLIDKANVIFHCAATVRFDEALDVAVNINVRGTRCVLDLAREAKNLKVVMHVSTAYANCPRSDIDEVLYDVPLDCDRVAQIVEAADEKLLERITPSLIDVWPNSYAFTKALGENVVKTHGAGLPIGVFRPAIVVNSAHEPMPGWIDNLYGPGGVVLASGSGIMHTLNAGKKCIADLVPVDMAVNALLVAAWETATASTEVRSSQPGKVPIYNYVSSVENRLTWGTFMALTSKWGWITPAQQAIYPYSLILCDWRITHTILTYLLHFLPALFVDIVCMLTGSKFRMIKIYKKIHKFSDVIAYFATREWSFHNGNVRSMWQRLSPTDQKEFYFDISSLDWDSYFHDYVLGMRLHMFKEDLKNVEQARAKHRKMWVGHAAVQIVTALVVLRVCWALLSWLVPGLGSVGSLLGMTEPVLTAVQASS
ncbi:fatty acyl-CoA reductase wat-like [Thrips palmi]|uniref:Fatty acyl-CoA reductase n=1 Tax=Thrips palmi TaxID=161013 RepID=A0A6P8ZU94_THRPL|nr:fatty acyl-CoA reductase wat-like [Thrips palmi]